MTAVLRLDAVRERVEALVPDLAGRLGNAGDFANLVERNQLPQVTPAGYVVPGGLRGLAADAATGLFRQHFQEIVSVVLVCRVAGDPLHARAIDAATPLVRATLEAVLGWAPDDAIGVFELVQAELVGAKDSALVFQIDFALNDQLRITVS
ncbi:MAG: hypothetical protein J0I69_02750 [Altererythrobacter sp.]|nr:hypothetical protein [Altererythrobacter sp.]OJU60938.1 MAG: hypothetical protein BGO08_12495 [Altererythrobacter sp. 66-12]